MPTSRTRLEILQYSYYEHYKYAKDLAFILDLEHPKRKRVERELNDILVKIQQEKRISNQQ